MIPTKTKITVLLNKYKGLITEFLIKTDSKLGKELNRQFSSYLKNDLCFILGYLYSDYSNYEYELLFISGLNDIVDEFRLGANLNFDRILSNWDNLSYDKKSDFLGITKDKIEFQDFLYSVIFLSKNDDGLNLVELKKLLYNISVDLTDIDNYVDSNESDKIVEIKNLIEESVNSKDFDYNKYTTTKLESLSINKLENIYKPSDLKNLIIENQKTIKEIDKNYLKNFLKIHKFLEIKHSQVEKSFESLNDSITSKKIIDDFSVLLLEQIFSYNVIYYYSLNMITSLLNQNFVTFYEVYEEFDELGVFKNKFERELSESLTDLNKNINDFKSDVVLKLSIIENRLEKVINGINQVNKNLSNVISNLVQIEESISSGFNSLNHTLESNFNNLNNNLNDGLNKINSSISTGNLINFIGAYQLYKINKNTSSLRLK